MPTEKEGVVLFWEMFKNPILNGHKIQSRRRGERFYEVGQQLEARVTETQEPFATLTISKVFQQTFNEMSDEEGYKDGFNNKAEFWETFQQIYPDIQPDETITVIEFQANPITATQ